jgi:hypothetical protein
MAAPSVRRAFMRIALRSPCSLPRSLPQAVLGRVTVFDLETLTPLGEIQNGGGNGAAVDPETGY